MLSRYGKILTRLTSVLNWLRPVTSHSCLPGRFLTMWSLFQSDPHRSDNHHSIFVSLIQCCIGWNCCNWIPSQTLPVCNIPQLTVMNIRPIVIHINSVTPPWFQGREFTSQSQSKWLYGWLGWKKNFFFFSTSVQASPKNLNTVRNK